MACNARESLPGSALAAFRQMTSASASIDVFASPGDAFYRPGQDAQISWVATSDISNVKIELSRDGGAFWEEIAASTPNDRRFTWNVTDGGEIATRVGCLVRVSDALAPLVDARTGSLS